MYKYLIKRLLHGLLSVIAVVAIVMILIYTLTNRDDIFAKDGQYAKQQANKKETYKYTKWESFGYLDYIPYADYLAMLKQNGEIDDATKSSAAKFGKTPDQDSEVAKTYIEKFQSFCDENGYTLVRLDYDAKTRQAAVLFAYKNISVFVRLWNYFTGIFQVDNVHYVEDTTGEALDDTGISFTLFDPVYNTNTEKKTFSPAIIGTGTRHRYLLYIDHVFPYIHQNVLSIRLGESYTYKKNTDIFDVLFSRQDPNEYISVTFPTGLTEDSPRDLHTAKYVKGSQGLLINPDRFTDDYTEVNYYKKNLSKTGFSFVIGIISVILSYLLGIPLGVLMAKKKDKLIDKLGTIYIVFIIAVPSLAYIFLFKAIGGKLGLPTSFDLESDDKLMYILPIISLALPSVAGLMKWIRRYMIDQMNSDYVRFARSNGLSEDEIFRKHILKNAAIPVIHGIPGSVLGALTGAIITESIYRVPGAGFLLTEAINSYDNGVIVGLTMFYSLLSIVSIILGDILMAMVDPRISFTDKAR